MLSRAKSKVRYTWNISVFWDCVTRCRYEKGYRFFTCLGRLGQRIFKYLYWSMIVFCDGGKTCDEAGNTIVLKSFLPFGPRRGWQHLGCEVDSSRCSATKWAALSSSTREVVGVLVVTIHGHTWTYIIWFIKEIPWHWAGGRCSRCSHTFGTFYKVFQRPRNILTKIFKGEVLRSTWLRF